MHINDKDYILQKLHIYIYNTRSIISGVKVGGMFLSLSLRVGVINWQTCIKFLSRLFPNAFSSQDENVL